jgi:hypothetical protein
MVRTIFVILIASIALATCNREIVIENDPGGGPTGQLRSATINIFTASGPSGRSADVEAGKLARLGPGDRIKFNGRTFVADSGGGTLTIRDGRLVLLGMKENER